MKTKLFPLVISFLILTLVISVLPGCGPVETAEGYMAVIPKVLHSGSTESLSLSLFSEGKLVSDRVEVTLLKEGEEVVKVKKSVSGKSTVQIDIPDIEEGRYEIRVKGTGFEDTAPVRVEKSFLVFLETDKPIYKPGQTIYIRAFTLNAELRPVSEQVTIEALDAKGIKIFRSEVQTDEYGMASLELPVSTEPNEGVWKLVAVTEKAKTQLDVRVEKYVLPKYEVKVELPKEWFLVDEPIQGKVLSEYSFGKAVKGELEITASRYVGEWQEYATYSAAIDGEADFDLPAVGYVAGVPAAGGLGNVMLEITVKEKATGYEETTSRLLSIADAPLNVQIIPESSVFKPGLPFSFLIVSETPDNEPLDTTVKVTVTYLSSEYDEVKIDEREVVTSKGKAVVNITPHQKSAAMIIETSAEGTQASKVLEASYSPSGNFIHIEQISEGIPEVGQGIIFRVYSTRQAANFYYEVISRGNVIFTDFTRSREISFNTTPLMAPSAKLLVYQILPNSEVAADYIPFKVEAEYPHEVDVDFGTEEAGPGEELTIEINTEGEAKVGIAAVDRSVFILAENRLNLQQVFDELERLYMEPQAELHEVSIYPSIVTRGAKDIFDDAGVVVLSNNEIPEGEEYRAQDQPNFWERMWKFLGGAVDMAEEADVVIEEAAPGADGTAGLAEVERIRQYFPETWLWTEIITGADGQASIQVQVPDTITTWMLRAVAISKEKGLGMSEDELVAFQPFFVKIDLPYSAIRGEEFPVKLAIYNYLEQPQNVTLQIERADWFDLLDDSQKTVNVGANDIGGAEFKIRPTKLGINNLKVTARSPVAADAMIKTLIVEPEGVGREIVENLVLSGGSTEVLDTSVPPFIVEDSGRVYLALTSSYLSQTIDGLDALIQMPFGCGEQNMILLAPDIYITKYLEESGQLKPEIMAKAEKLMITGYQRELTYQRNDGSFSAFGQSDDQGSLWLTAFVLKSFAQATDLIYIDENVLDQATEWITEHQNNDGSFDAIGFVHHQEMVGGLSGKTALTAYTAIALLEAGEKAGSGRAVDYLEGMLDRIDDPYTMALTAYALELAQSDKVGNAYQLLMGMAEEDEHGLHWGGDDGVLPEETMDYHYNQSANIEATGYATLALVEHGDVFNASRAARWLVSKRNAYGGFGSTQDTVVALQALTSYSTGARADVDLTISVESDSIDKAVRITQENFDVLQVIEIPINETVELNIEGEGEAIAQLVKRFNLPDVEAEGEEILRINVDYDTTEVEVNDLVEVSVELEFNPPIPMEAGMIVLDVSVPTGFTPVTESIAELVEREGNIKRYEIAGRKVIFYIENMFSGDRISFTFSVQAMYPVKAKGVSSQAYSYYKPEIRGETLGEAVTVR